MANINSQNINKAEEALQLAYKDLISFGKLFLIHSDLIISKAA